MSARLEIISNTRVRLVAEPALVSLVDKATSFEHVGFNHSKKYRQWLKSGGKWGWDGKTHLLTTGSRTFPVGLFRRVEQVLERAGASPEVVDLRTTRRSRRLGQALRTVNRASEPSRPEKRKGEAGRPPPERALRDRLARILPGKVLREDQIDAVLTCVKEEKGIVWAATGSGKTEVAIALTKLLLEEGEPGAVLFLSNRKKLLRDTHRRFAEGLKGCAGDLWPRDVGFLSEGAWEDDAPVLVASISTLSHKNNKARLKKLLKRVTVVIVDECFPAGTFIGSAPIEQLKPGDVVPSFDASTNTFTTRQVTHTFKSVPSALVCVRLENGNSVTCTPGHPFWTQRGWQPAVQLTSADMVLQWCHDSARAEEPVHDVPHDLRRLWPRDRYGSPLVRASDAVLDMSPSTSRPTPSRTQHSMFDLSKPLDVNRTSTCQGGSSQKSVLLSGMLGRVSQPALVRDDDHDEPAVCGGTVEPHDQEQPDAQPCYTKEAQSHAAAHRAPPTMDRREGPRTDDPAASAPHTATSNRHEMVRRVLGQNGEGRHPAPHHLPRLGAPEAEDRCGGGRREPRPSEDESSRPPQGGVPSWTWVAGVEVLEPGSDGRYGGMCPDGHVYNIEVEGTHTYLAEGIVVHNCQHLGSSSWFRLVARIPADIRIGLSATPLDRGDGKNLLIVAALGEIIFEIRAKTLIEQGILAKPTVTITPVRIPDELEELDYDTAYYEGVVKNLWRNSLIAKLCPKKGRTLVLVQQIEHGHLVQAALRAAGFHAPFLHGNTDADDIDSEVARFRRGKLPVLIASAIFREGVDIPETDHIVIADGGKSVIKTLQQVGRGTRKKAGANAVHVHDFADLVNPYLADHSLQRIETYRREGFEVEFNET